MNFIIRTIITAVVAYGLTYILSGVHITDFKAALIFALVLAVLNAIVKPIITFLTLPVTIITLGLFLLVINAFVIIIADKLLDSVTVDGFWWALGFSLLLSIVSSALFSVVKDNE